MSHVGEGIRATRQVRLVMWQFASHQTFCPSNKQFTCASNSAIYDVSFLMRTLEACCLFMCINPPSYFVLQASPYVMRSLIIPTVCMTLAGLVHYLQKMQGSETNSHTARSLRRLKEISIDQAKRAQITMMQNGLYNQYLQVGGNPMVTLLGSHYYNYVHTKAFIGYTSSVTKAKVALDSIETTICLLYNNKSLLEH